ncbi:DUF808 family protein [Xylophilus rhododendri]|uniref:DUF808 family protein n=1 Tax=Xylophilus rhododendri TaxID=2697032 RepID=A0A857IYN1_9BURK|nr:DUF808 domain-containing protein [Xylophilus rhododendri]QHI96670.1 DUF808 family protein [Xylophilus rhododendri]
MAAGSLLTLLDDITTLLDDISVMAKVAAKKTAGVLGDDLAVNAEQVHGVQASRELPVVWAVCKGSLLNKLILVPAALAISAMAPWLVTPLLMLGGAYLCYEGAEKLAHRFLHSPEQDQARKEEQRRVLARPAMNLAALEKEKIKGAIRTDFILSAEIIAITLGVVQDEPFLPRLLVMAGVAFVMTIGVYGIVAAIVRLDDLGLYLIRRGTPRATTIGKAILRAAPWLMKTLSVLGTAAMFLVGGGILVHGLEPVAHALEDLGTLAGAGINAMVGLVAGGLLVAAMLGWKRLRR